MLSISGLHVAIIAAAIRAPRARAPAARAAPRRAATMALVALYVAVIGAPPPALRSAVMLGVAAARAPRAASDLAVGGARPRRGGAAARAADRHRSRLPAQRARDGEPDRRRDASPGASSRRASTGWRASAASLALISDDRHDRECAARRLVLRPREPRRAAHQHRGDAGGRAAPADALPRAGAHAVAGRGARSSPTPRIRCSRRSAPSPTPAPRVPGAAIAVAPTLPRRGARRRDGHRAPRRVREPLPSASARAGARAPARPRVWAPDVARRAARARAPRDRRRAGGCGRAPHAARPLDRHRRRPRLDGRRRRPRDRDPLPPPLRRRGRALRAHASARRSRRRRGEPPPRAPPGRVLGRRLRRHERELPRLARSPPTRRASPGTARIPATRSPSTASCCACSPPTRRGRPSLARSERSERRDAWSSTARVRFLLTGDAERERGGAARRALRRRAARRRAQGRPPRQPDEQHRRRSSPRCGRGSRSSPSARGTRYGHPSPGGAARAHARRRRRAAHRCRGDARRAHGRRDDRGRGRRRALDARAAARRSASDRPCTNRSARGTFVRRRTPGRPAPAVPRPGAVPVVTHTTTSVVTIERFIIEQERLHPEATGELSGILYDMALAAKMIANKVRSAGLADILGSAGHARTCRARCSRSSTSSPTRSSSRRWTTAAGSARWRREEEPEIIQIPERLPPAGSTC